MNRNLGTKTALIIATLLIFTWGIFLGNNPKKSWDAFQKNGPMAAMQENIHLGLDLRGGTHLILQVMVDEAVGAEVDRAADRIKELLQGKKATFTNITRSVEHADQMTLKGIGTNDLSTLRSVVESNFSDYDLSTGSNGDYLLTMKSNPESQLKSNTVTRSIETIRSRVDALGVSEPVIQEHGLGDYQILVQLPGVDDPVKVRSIIQETGMLEFRLVEGGPFDSEAQAAAGNTGSSVVLPMEGKGGETKYYLISRTGPVSGEDIRSASPATGQYGGNVTTFNLKTDAGKRFAAFTEANVNRPLAVILNGKVKNIANIKERIGDTGQIEGLTLQEAQDLGKLLESGALPASIKYLEDRTVGASLGRDSIRQGVTAGIVGLLLVVGFMLFYYHASGINANLALLLNVIILLGFLGFSGATLTLPGIAGVILTVGMGVDSNVLIFERIREEMRLGKSPSASVDQGFGRAWLTIIDTHITTIVSALILFVFGSGPVRGFAVTLAFGLAANLFTAVFVSRVIFDYLISKKERGEALSI
jgi:preprotein translocase subunit SecD